MIGVIRWRILALGVCTLTACGTRVKQEAPSELSQYVLERAPREMENSRFIDFGGKVHLLGFDLDPTGNARPGDSVKLTLYWKSVAPLTRGWNLFTHLSNEYGRQIDNYDNIGPLRQLDGNAQVLSPSKWQRGKVYVDRQEISIPRPDPNLPWRENVTSTVTLVTGVWRGPMRLEVISGPSDGENSGIVAHLSTGLEAPAPKADEMAAAEVETEGKP
jgi:hypothetical protein